MNTILRIIWLPSILLVVLILSGVSYGQAEPFGRNQDCVCAELQGYVDYLKQDPVHLVNSPVPRKYKRKRLRHRCRTTISEYAYRRITQSIRSYVYYCYEGERQACLSSERDIQRICPTIGLGPLPPAPPATRQECYYRCKSKCGRAREPFNDFGNLTTDPKCLQRCSDKCDHMFRR